MRMELTPTEDLLLDLGETKRSDYSGFGVHGATAQKQKPRNCGASVFLSPQLLAEDFGKG
jgi:hypothetical protein